MSPIAALYCFTIFGISLISATTVKWLPNSSFKLPENYKGGKLPCSKQTVVFPEVIAGSVKIAPGTEVHGFILPEDGELVLDGNISFGANPADTNCTEGNAYYLDKRRSSWNQADVWSSPKFNEATPDSDRVPCFNDEVEFPENSRFTLKLPDKTQYVKSIKIGGVRYSTTRSFISRILTQSSSDTQQFVLNDFISAGILIGEWSGSHYSQFGSPCQQYPMEIECSAKFCPKPACSHPVKPLGFCCEICGGYILFDADEQFEMEKLDKLVESTVNGYGKDSIVYYIGLSPEIPYRRIQLVVVDKGEYVGSSAEIINSISYTLQDQWVKGRKVAQISGSPLSQSGLGAKIFVSMFFAVVLTLGGLYAYYYKVPDLRVSRVPRYMGGNIFSRFQRRSDSVVSLTRRDSVISARSNTAFRNPLYNSKRGRVLVAESAVEE